ncbi:MAG: transporter [Salinirussus sp.]
MAIVDAASYAVHLLFGGLWTGSVLFTTYAVLPTAAEGNLNAAPLSAVAGKLQTVSRVSALVLLATGAHLGVVRYTVGSLTGSLSGYLVIAMILLWLALAGLVEVGTARLTDGTERDKVREPAARARPLLLGASLIAALLLANSGLLVARSVGLL